MFTDEQALLSEKATLYSGTSEEASLKDELMESSQPESQVSLGFFNSGESVRDPGVVSLYFSVHVLLL